jgi:molybdopterin-guanine dinucleotide biosynthesis protein A
MADAGVILLAGGQSSRMGTNKALLSLGGKKNVERIVDELSKVSSLSTPLIVTNQPDVYSWLELPMTSDVFPGQGPLAGIHAGMLASDHKVNLVVACDMPFVSSSLARWLLEQAGNYDATVPRITPNVLHPLFAVYFTETCLPVVEACLQGGQLRVTDMLSKLGVNYVNPVEDGLAIDVNLAFYNMNHPHEYKQAKKWADKEN